MRQVSLIVVGFVCGVLLYNHLSGPDPTGLRAAQASVSQPPKSGETRLQKLQHYQAALQVLEIELARYQQLRKADLNEMDQHIYANFRKTLTKDLQETWDRMKSPKKDIAWMEKAGRTQDEADREHDKKEMLDAKVKAYYQALLDARSDDAKKWGKQFEGRPAEKEIHWEADLIDLLTRERDETRAALMHD